MVTLSLTHCGNCGHPLMKDIQPPKHMFHGFLGGNYKLSKHQVDNVRETIAITLARTSEIDNEISRMEEALEILRGKREDLRTCESFHRDLVAPVRCLPSEILCEIFDHCITTQSWVNDDPLAQKDISPRLDKTPLLLASVCRYWRGTMLVTPKLWSSISLNFQLQHLKTDVSLVGLWLAHAKNWPLSINLEGGLRPAYAEIQAIMAEVASRSDRWRNIRLLLPISTMGCLSPAKGHLPKLRTLSIGLIRESPTDVIDTFEFAPQLRCLQLRSQIAISSFKAPWSQIVHCDLTGCFDAQINLDILETLTNAETCILAPDILDPITHRPVRLSNLHSLTISIFNDIRPFLHALELPVLESLVVITHFGAYTTSQLTSILAQCTLKKLIWCGIESPGHTGLLDILQATPELRELHLTNGAVNCLSEDFFAKFTPSYDSGMPPLAPRLRIVKLGYDGSCAQMVACVDAIIDRTSTRTAGEDEIAVIVECADELELLSHHRSRFLQLRDSGLDVCVCTQTGKDLL